MVGSPNPVRFVYDGDGDAFGEAGPEGSAEIEKTFTDYFASQGLATAPTAFDGRSDYFAFIDADKAGYSLYVDLILERMRPGGLIVVDNALFGGEVLAAARGDQVSENAAAIHAFNEAVAADDRVECSLVNVGDGLLLIRKR